MPILSEKSNLSKSLETNENDNENVGYLLILNILKIMHTLLY